jgi:hypothetical protein
LGTSLKDFAIGFFFIYCTGNMLQKACGKFVFLLNNCLSKKAYFFILWYRHWADNLKKIDCGSKQFVKHLTARIKNFVLHFTGNKSSKMYIQTAEIFMFLLHKCLQPKWKKKSKKARSFPANCLTIYWNIPSDQKCLCRPMAGSKQTIGFSGLHTLEKKHAWQYNERKLFLCFNILFSLKRSSHIALCSWY